MSSVSIFDALSHVDDVLWSFVAVPLVLALGIFFTIKARGLQLTRFFSVCHYFAKTCTERHQSERGINPLQAFFTSIGGCIGIGNLVAVCTAVQIGGPGAVFWMWVAAFLGMLVKYAEVYLGVLHRVPNDSGGYDGGPMFYLKKICKTPWVPRIFAILLAMYGAEVYMFKVVTDSIVINWSWEQNWVILVLLALIILAASGGIQRVGKICSAIIPTFLGIFMLMSGYVIIANITLLPDVFQMILSSAFNGHAAIGGFAGSGCLLAMSQGIARGCYTGDIGVGYAAVVHAESRESKPSAQAGLAILGIVIDTFVVCTLTTLLVLVTGVWSETIPASHLVQTALAQYFPGMQYFMPVFIFLLGYSTIIAFFCVGVKSMKFVFPKQGQKLFYLYAIPSFIIFSYVDQSEALLIMSIVGALLLCINIIGIYRLRREIDFFSKSEKKKVKPVVASAYSS